MPISTIDPAYSTDELVALGPDGTTLRARRDGAGLTVFVSDGCWKRAPADAKAIEGRARFLLIDVGGKQRVARVAATGNES